MPRGRYHQNKVPGANTHSQVPGNAGQGQIRPQPVERPASQKPEPARSPERQEQRKEQQGPAHLASRLEFKRNAQKFSSPTGALEKARVEIQRLGIDGMRAQREEIAKNIVSIAIGELSSGDAAQVKMQLVLRGQKGIANDMSDAIGFLKNVEGLNSQRSSNTAPMFESLDRQIREAEHNPLKRHALMVARERIIRHLESRL
jgi:hypothetical protein